MVEPGWPSPPVFMLGKVYWLQIFFDLDLVNTFDSDINLAINSLQENTFQKVATSTKKVMFLVGFACMRVILSEF